MNMKMPTHRPIAYAIGFFMFIALLLVPHIVLAAPTMSSVCASSPTGVDYKSLISPILGPIDSASSQLFTGSGTAAKYLFTLLGTIELVWFIAHTLFFKREIHDLLHGTGFKIVSLMFLMAVIVGLSQNGGSAIKNIVFNDFASLGQDVGNGFNNNTPGFGSGTTAYTGNTGSGSTIATSEAAPISNILSQGDCASYAIITWPATQWNTQLYGNDTINIQNIVNKLLNPLAAAQNMIEALISIPGIILGFLVGTLIGLTYLYLAGLMLMATIDGLITLSVGLILLGFAGSRWTSAMADNYTKLIFHTGFKILAINIVAGLGMGMIGSAVNAGIATAMPGGVISGPALPYSTLGSLLIIAALVALLAKNVNGIANTLAGSPSINLAGSAASAAVGAAMVGAAAATGGAALAGGLASKAAAGGALSQGASAVGAAGGKALSGAPVAAVPPSAPVGTPGAAGAAAAPAPAPIGSTSGSTQLPSAANAPVPATNSQPSPSSSTPSQAPVGAGSGSGSRFGGATYTAGLADDDDDLDETYEAPIVEAPAELVGAAALARPSSPSAPPISSGARTTRGSATNLEGSGSASRPSTSPASGGGASSRSERPGPTGFVVSEEEAEINDAAAIAETTRASRPGSSGAPQTGGGNGNSNRSKAMPGASGTSPQPPPRLAAPAAAAAALESAASASAPPSRPAPAAAPAAVDVEEDDEELNERDLTQRAKEARIKKLRSITNSIKSSLEQHHKHHAVPPGPTIRH
jgi:hypothetical protein